MRRVCSFAASLLSATVLLGAPANFYAATACESSLPFNIDTGILEPIAIALLRQSPTFRQQCQRIAAAASAVRVQVRVVRRLYPGGRAETVMRRYDAGALHAEVSLEFGGDYGELLAHEFEHVLEQMEHVNLRQLPPVQAWVTPDGAFETQRAMDIGTRARQEREPLAAEAVEANRRAAPLQRDPIE